MSDKIQRRKQQRAKIVSGSVGSLLTATAVHPLEVVKVRTQAKTSKFPSNVALCPQGCGTFVINNGLGDYTVPKSSSCFGGTGQLKPLTSTKSVGTFGIFRRILSNEGLGGLYAGLTPTLTMGVRLACSSLSSPILVCCFLLTVALQVPNTVLYFLSYDELSVLLLPYDKSASWTPAFAGAAARFVASLSTAPFELLRTIQASRASSDHPAPGMIAEFRSIVRNDGFLSLYKGLFPTLVRDVPFSAIYWLGIEKCRRRWASLDSDSGGVVSTQTQGARALFNGTVSGLVASACTTPLDVIKTRQQLQTNPVLTMESAAPGCDHSGYIAYQQNRRAGALYLLLEILREEGVKGLWKGNVARMTKVAPACACMISSYEIGQRLLLAPQ
eukprot:scaffold2470_cov114-Cylindrotheca_fusiformis.AAC.2